MKAAVLAYAGKHPLETTAEFRALVRTIRSEAWTALRMFEKGPAGFTKASVVEQLQKLVVVIDANVTAIENLARQIDPTIDWKEEP